MAEVSYSSCCPNGDFSALGYIERAVIDALLRIPSDELNANIWFLETLVDCASANNCESKRLATLRWWLSRLTDYSEDFSTPSDDALAECPSPESVSIDKPIQNIHSAELGG